MNAKFQAWDEHGINAIGGGPIHSQIHLQLGEPGVETRCLQRPDYDATPRRAQIWAWF